MICAIHQPQFLPYLGFFHKVARCDVYVVLDDVQFLERGFQHRNTIKMQTGTQWLTVPVVQNRGQLFTDVVIDSSTNWRRKHWAAIETNYRKAPFFSTIAPRLREILVDGKQTRMMDLDMDLLTWTMEYLDTKPPTRLSSSLAVAGAKSERLINICKAVGADVYLSGVGGREYMELPLFEAAGIEVRFQEYTAKPYLQLYPQHGFLPHLAVIDAMFNCGPEARSLIT